MYIVAIGLLLVTIGLAIDEADRVKKNPKLWITLIKIGFGIAMSLWLPSVVYFTLTRSDVPLNDLILWIILYPATFLVGLGMLLMLYGKTNID
ncbi:MAG: hypothetical protein JXR88_01865 [Clostridia bacterium]|nr:hypothetical protein [Clostridia bacterium]